MAKKSVLSEDTTKLIDTYETLDKAYKEEWEKFETKQRKTLEHLDQLREKRNAALDDAKRSLREEAKLLPKGEKSVSYGPFRATKPEGYLVDVLKAYKILEGHDLVGKALEDKVLEYEYKIDLEKMRAWARTNDLASELAECEKPKDLSPTIYGPKPVPEFGAEQKESPKK